MENTEIKEMSELELIENINSEKKALQNLVFAHAVSQIENPMRIRFARKYVAQLSAELRKKQLEKVKSMFGQQETTTATTKTDFLKKIDEIEQSTGIKVGKKFVSSLAKGLNIKENNKK